MVKKTGEASVVYLVRVTTDDRLHQLWVASASSDEEAITLVLNRVPEGWAAALLSNKLKPIEITALNLKPGEAKEITRVSAIAGSSAKLPPLSIDDLRAIADRGIMGDGRSHSHHPARSRAPVWQLRGSLA